MEFANPFSFFVLYWTGGFVFSVVIHFWVYSVNGGRFTELMGGHDA